MLIENGKILCVRSRVYSLNCFLDLKCLFNCFNTLSNLIYCNYFNYNLFSCFLLVVADFFLKFSCSI